MTQCTSWHARTYVILLMAGVSGLTPGGTKAQQESQDRPPDVLGITATPGTGAADAAPAAPALPLTSPAPRVWTRAEWARTAHPCAVAPYNLLHQDLVLHDLRWGTGDGRELGRARTTGRVQGTVTT